MKCKIANGKIIWKFQNSCEKRTVATYTLEDLALNQVNALQEKISNIMKENP